MPKIQPKLIKTFAGSIPAAGNIETFGSTAAGAPTYSLDPDILQSARYLLGWAAGIIGNGSPVMQDRTMMDFLITRQLAYQLQSGVNEWLATATYYAGSWTSDPTTGLYRSLTDNNIGHNPVTDSNNWISLADFLVGKIVSPAAVCKAWVLFDGTNGDILAGYNVNSVVRNSAGIYTLFFGLSMLNAFYTFSGSCSSINGGSPTSGNNNVIIGGGQQLAASLRIINWESSGGPIGPEDGQRISVQVFGN